MIHDILSPITEIQIFVSHVLKDQSFGPSKHQGPLNTKSSQQTCDRTRRKLKHQIAISLPQNANAASFSIHSHNKTVTLYRIDIILDVHRNPYRLRAKEVMCKLENF